MKIIKYLLITIIIFSCEENNLTKWVNYDESSELIESQENENRRLRYQRIQSISKDKNHIRWFSPLKEVDLCGHATLNLKNKEIKLSDV